MDIEVKNICPGKPERPIKGSEWTFDNLRGEWFEEAKLDGDRVILAHGTAFNRHEELYQRDFSNKLGDIYDELRQLFNDCKVFDIEYMATGDNAGKCALLDIPDMVSMHIYLSSVIQLQPVGLTHHTRLDTWSCVVACHVMTA